MDEEFTSKISGMIFLDSSSENESNGHDYPIITEENKKMKGRICQECNQAYEAKVNRYLEKYQESFEELKKNNNFFFNQSRFYLREKPGD